ncbi:unnamed protein product [Prunus armeniaca]
MAESVSECPTTGAQSLPPNSARKPFIDTWGGQSGWVGTKMTWSLMVYVLLSDKFGLQS